MINDLKVRTDWTYNAILNDKARADQQADGYFEIENRANFLLGYWGKARLAIETLGVSGESAQERSRTAHDQT